MMKLVYREAEVTQQRVAMLAVVGFFVVDESRAPPMYFFLHDELNDLVAIMERSLFAIWTSCSALCKKYRSFFISDRHSLMRLDSLADFLYIIFVVYVMQFFLYFLNNIFK